ncbi:MAG: DNA polymerase III subunit delta [Bryobacteraceae bacterium]
MTPDQFLSRIKKGLAPAYLFLGAEIYSRDRCRSALVEAALTPEERENGLVRFDLAGVSLREVVDDARSLSLFAPRRMMIVSGAEQALPKLKTSASEDDETGGKTSGASEALAAYLKDPTPEVVLLVECTRFEFEGEDKKKLDRVKAFYGAIPEVVEMRRFSSDEARLEAMALAKRTGISIGHDAVEVLVDSLGADMSRIAIEMEKLRLFAGTSRAVTVDDIAALAPDARSSTIFALVNALGRRDRRRSLEILDTLAREGEYLPLTLSFVSSQFRMALASKQAGLRSPQQILGYFAKAGVAIWSSRAEQIYQTMAKFSASQLEIGMRLLFEADRNIRDARPDDRIVMEKLIFDLTAAASKA